MKSEIERLYGLFCEYASCDTKAYSELQICDDGSGAIQDDDAKEVWNYAVKFASFTDGIEKLTAEIERLKK